MKKSISYTTEEIAQILKVSKLTVYDLIKKGDLPSYRVGRQIRVDANDLEVYKELTKSGHAMSNTEMYQMGTQPLKKLQSSTTTRQVIISGQDISLDILANHIEKSATGYRPLRAYTGSLNSLIAMYQGEADIVSTHLYDGETDTYNLPYIRRMLVSHPYLVIHFLSRRIGFYVRKGNPDQIQDWADLMRPTITMVNREKGAGVRVLIDEKLRLAGISPSTIKGYGMEESNHVGVASKVLSGQADVGVGTEKTAHLVGVDFIPIIRENYDLVIRKDERNENFIEALIQIVKSDALRLELEAIGGYDLSRTGEVIDETPS